MKRFIYGILGIWVIVACVCLAAPEPAIVPAPGQWTLDMEFTHPQQITLPRGSDKKQVQFWYTIITLTNNTGNDVDFYPKCDLMTDSFQIIPAGKFVSSMLFDQIKRRHKSKYPFLEPLNNAGSKILQGEDNTKDIAVIWPDFDTQAKSIRLFITGLSNETVAVDHPVSTGADGRPLQIFLRKTLELSYSLRGDQALRSNASFAYQGKRWVMR
ncbi:MAG: hypothetical protein WBC05_21280 [Sedimentisphaerales bacterium]